MKNNAPKLRSQSAGGQSHGLAVNEWNSGIAVHMSLQCRAAVSTFLVDSHRCTKATTHSNHRGPSTEALKMRASCPTIDNVMCDLTVINPSTAFQSSSRQLSAAHSCEKPTSCMATLMRNNNVEIACITETRMKRFRSAIAKVQGGLDWIQTIFFF